MPILLQLQKLPWKGDGGWAKSVFASFIGWPEDREFVEKMHFGASYWAIQAGLLTPLTFSRHRLSPLAAFTTGAYFLHNGRWWQWICEFYTANFKAITCCSRYRMPQRTHDLLVSQKTTQRHFFSNPPSPFHGNYCNCNSIGICTASRF